MPSCPIPASQCPALPETPFASQEVLNGGGRSYGTVVRFECEPGYYRTGLPVIHCMSNGSWSGDVPTCSRIQCHEYPEVRFSCLLLIGKGKKGKTHQAVTSVQFK